MLFSHLSLFFQEYNNVSYFFNFHISFLQNNGISVFDILQMPNGFADELIISFIFKLQGIIKLSDFFQFFKCLRELDILVR